MALSQQEKEQLQEALNDPFGSTFSALVQNFIDRAGPNPVFRLANDMEREQYERRYDASSSNPIPGAKNWEFITRQLRQVNPQKHVEHYKATLQWLCVGLEEIQECLEDVQVRHEAQHKNSRGMMVSAGLRLTSILERSLKDLIWTHRTRQTEQRRVEHHEMLKKKEPSGGEDIKTVEKKEPVRVETREMLKKKKLSEVLQSEALKDLIGEEEMGCLSILMRSPESLNIRNLLWHGFGSVLEKPEFIAIGIHEEILAIGKILHAKSTQVEHLELSDINTQTEHLNSQVMPNITAVDEEDFETFSSKVKIKSDEIAQARDYARKGRYGLAVMMLLPSFEHIAKIIFCVYNRCPDRVQTADSSVHFTTFDQIFKETFPDPVDTITNPQAPIPQLPNAMYEALPDRLHAALGDLLVYTNGFELRNKLGHMDIDHKKITEEVWTFCYKVVSTTILYLVDGEDAVGIEKYLIEDYVPLFHPMRETLKAVELVDSQINPLHLAFCPEISVHDDCRRMAEHFDVESDTVDSLQKLLRDPSSQLPAFRIGAKWHSLPRKVAEEMQKVLQSVLDFSANYGEMLGAGTCNAKQRENLKKFLDCKAAFEEIFQTIHTVVLKMVRDALTNPDFQVLEEHQKLLDFSSGLLAKVNQHKWIEVVDNFQHFVNKKCK